MKNSRTLQVMIMGVVTALFAIVVSKIPKTYELFGIKLYLHLVIFLIWFLIITFVVAIISLGMSQIQSIHQPTRNKLIKFYDKAYSFSFKTAAGIMILAVSFNIATYLSPIIKGMDLDSLVVILTIIIVIIVFDVFNKKGIKLWEDGK